MGGFGSGRPTGSGRAKVEACRSIDANRLHRQGCLRAGSMASCQWSRDGGKVTPTNMRAEHDRLHLTYRVHIGGGEWEDVARPSASSACPAATVECGPILSAPAS